MNITKLKYRLEVAYDLIAEIHSQLCNNTTRDNDITDDTTEILRRILVLDKKLKKVRSDGK